jgi:hypothetical protein
MNLIDIFKDISIKEYKRAGIGALMIIVAVWYLYTQNQKQADILARHQIKLENRVDKLEIDIIECNTAKFEVLRQQVDKSNNLIEKTDRHLDVIENLIKNK